MIELDDVFVLYPCLDRQVAALRGLTLSVAAGERVVIAGPSGSGKSTLVRLITGQVRPSAGIATVLDHDLVTASPQAVLALQRSGVGVITQHMTANLADELSVLDNVAMQSRLSGSARATARASALEMLARLGVDSLAMRRLSTISAGEAQRVAIAAALAHRPRVIVADEPTGALDLANANAVFDLLAELSTELDAALLVVSHDTGAARIGHRVLEIRDGRLGSEAIHGSPQPRLVVDDRGWVRLPDVARTHAGITNRAIVDSPADALAPHDATAIVLQAPAGEASRHIAEPIAQAAASHEIQTIITAVDVSVALADRTTVILAPTSVQVNTGELLLITGRSGSGKTTLLSLLAGFAEPSLGHLQRDPLTRVAVGTASLGFAESMSIRHNVELACTVRGQRVDPALHDAVSALLHDLGIDELADRPVATLSGGERQRASIARSLASDADLIVLDEPTSQLDQAHAHQVARVLLAHARRGRAIVCASHEPELIAAADRVHPLAG